MEQTKYGLRVELVMPLLGTQPQKDVATAFLQGKARDLGIDTTDENDTLPEMLQKGTTVFHRQGEQLLYVNYQVKGFLKESARIQNGDEGVSSVKALRSKVDNYVFVNPRFIPLQVPQGATVEYLERPLRAETAQGPQTALARSEMLPAGTVLECELLVLGKVITEKILRALLDYGALKGLGQWRNGGYGQFTYTLTVQ